MQKNVKKRTILLVALTVSMLITTSACTGTPSNSSSQSSTIISEIESSEPESKETSSEGVSSEEVSSEEVSSAPAAAKPGESVQNSNLKISLTSAKLYDSINVGEGDFSFETKPDDGKKYLILFFEAENISDEDQYINIFYYDSYLDDTAVESETLLTDVEGCSMFTGDIASGKKLKGYVAYQVDPDWEKLEFTYTDGVSSDSDKYNFIVTPADFA